MNDLFLTVNEVADLLKIHPKTVYKLGDKIPGYLKMGGTVLFNRQTFLNGTRGAQPRPEKASREDVHGLL